ncbi:hypothetical protein [Magnetospirillum sp. UT-4]|uniref:hypothetical protein n=1 Tax=Magnetospirillum sp. UT-4 TaxID=2681467 RepID=UPI0013818785|nr:hypothetical protein [Magnetospirillum sp. UT-4]CAA7611649.1 hypothetical protein MTBUT4_100038 [Magnetospirillum sp. UT-4]
MTASPGTVVPFPALDANSLTWHLRGLTNAARMSTLLLSRIESGARSVRADGAEQLAFARKADAVADVLTRLSLQLSDMRARIRGLVEDMDRD